MLFTVIRAIFLHFFKSHLTYKLPIDKSLIRKFMQLGVRVLIILIASIQLLFAKPVRSQTLDQVVISVALKNETLVQAFQKIEAQTPFHFMYRKEEVKAIGNLNLAPGKLNVAVLLRILLANTDLTYQQVDNQILIIRSTKKKQSSSPASIDISKTLFNNVVIKGQVTNAARQPQEGVSILLKGTSMGTSTGVDGRYAINVPENGILVFSYIGFVSQEVAVNSRTTIDVQLQEKASSLNDVVVTTALGIKREARSLTYSTQGVKTQNLTEARDLNVMNSLEGKVAGLSITSSGTGIGGSDRVILRGNRSISGDSQPLYVIDGVPVIGDPSDISPDNIASINVLKGPNAAALYGAAAQNGVIIIETKKGRAGAINISLNHTYQMLTPIESIRFQNEYAQGIAGVYLKASESSWGPKMTGQTVGLWSINPADAGKQYALTPQPNNVRDAFRNGFSTATNLNASMGGEKIQGMFSFTRTDAKGNVPGNTLGRNNLAVRVTSQLTNRLTLDTKIDYMQQVIHDPVVEDINTLNPVKQIYMMPRNIRTEDARNYSFADASGVIRQNFWNPGSTLGLNPYFLLNRASNISTRQRGIVMASLSYDFSNALKLMVRGAYDVVNRSSEDKLSKDFYSRALNGLYTVTKSYYSLFNGDFLLTYTRKIHKDWNFNINFGGNMQQQRNNSLSSNTGVGMVVPDFFTLSNTLAPATSYDPGPDIDIQSLYAFSHLGWKNALFLDITGRNDWSSTLPAAHRSYFYPSVGLSAVLSDLIPKLPEQISLAKLRASWAKVGSGGPAYMLNRKASFSSGGNNGFLQLNSILPNPDLLPEQTNAYEIGLDISLFKNRLDLNVTGYKTNTLNQLFTVALPPGSGASQYFTNGGDVENKGIEIILSGILVRTGDFKWETNLNFSRNRNMVNKLNDERPKLIVGSDQSFRDFVVIQGQPFGQIYSIGFLRDAKGNVVVGSNGVPLNTGSRSVSVANANPDWMGGITNSFSYKNLSLSFLIDHRQGGTVLSVTNAMLMYEGLTEETLPGRAGGLIFGKNLFPDKTAVKADGTPNDIAVNAETFWRTLGGTVNPVGEAFVENMTNTRLREVMLGYTLPKSLLGNLPVSRVKLSLVGRNLFFIYRASHNLDPDISAGTNVLSEGQTSFAPPSTRSYGLNLKIDFK
jgi:TonB-linked SusC/RagA family outer membrane protein